jgi:hypothetical protein
VASRNQDTAESCLHYESSYNACKGGRGFTLKMTRDGNLSPAGRAMCAKINMIHHANYAIDHFACDWWCGLN